MAVVAQADESKVKVVLQTTVDGKVSYKSRTFGNVKADATDEGIFMVGTEIGKLQKHTVDRVCRIDETVLVQG